MKRQKNRPPTWNHYHRESNEIQARNDESDHSAQDPRMQSLLNEYADVFKEKLPDQLPPPRGLVHEINPGKLIYMGLASPIRSEAR